jgi:putative FmdB family regulatory protein
VPHLREGDVPTYAYACTECEHRFDVQQAFTDDSLTVCPECSGRLRKLFNAVGIVFKGSGFYRTDSRGKSTSSTVPAGSGESAGSSSSSSDGGSSASAPAAASSSSPSSSGSSESSGSAGSSSSTGSSGSGSSAGSSSSKSASKSASKTSAA